MLPHRLRLIPVVMLTTGMIVSHAIAQNAAPADSASLPAWRSWLHSGPPMLVSDDETLRENFRALSPSEQAAASRYIFDTWNVKHRPEVDELRQAVELRWYALITDWAQKDFEAVFRRVEEWEGYHGNELRIALVRQMAARDPIAAARFMRLRLNPMSKQYYYYVLIEGLVPALKDQPMERIMAALEEMRSGEKTMDDFRWRDATYYLLSGEKPWTSPNLEADWKYLLAQKPGKLRTILLTMVLQQALEKDFNNAVKFDLSSSQMGVPEIEEVLRKQPPKPTVEAFERFLEADPLLMQAWVNLLVRQMQSPNWGEWSEHVLRLEPKSRRDKVLPAFTRLRLLHDEFPARQWAATLADPAARTLAEQQVMISEVIHQASENWDQACAAARAFNEPEARRRALEGVFKAGVHLPLSETTTQAAAAAATPGEVDGLIDSWTSGQIELAMKDGKRFAEGYAFILTLRAPATRQHCLEKYDSLGRSIGFEIVRKLVGESALGGAEKSLLLQDIATDEVDALLSGFHAPDESGGPKAALEAANRIPDPELRFIHQRSIVHDSVRSDVAEARHQVETARVDAETKSRLMKEWERVSRWYVPEK
ncbi:hypothetical protein [Verrucomicrobium sp. BvORR034]|uniref:hypothetical protein n=1 Tax=Verrucomicrobium sp. BvORR034 TaxID=1396418 RepID=UPI0006797BFC|nr:hypothetical protein [Verrucomicrobium sp. BvORR034]